MYSFELTKGYSKPIDATCLPTMCSHGHLAWHETLVARRKFSLMVCSHTARYPLINLGHLEDIFIKPDKGKRSTCLASNAVLSIYRSARHISVLSLANRPVLVPARTCVISSLMLTLLSTLDSDLTRWVPMLELACIYANLSCEAPSDEEG